MENPLVYGRYVTGEAFTDREEELAHLVRELASNGRCIFTDIFFEKWIMLGQ